MVQEQEERKKEMETYMESISSKKKALSESSMSDVKDSATIDSTAQKKEKVEIEETVFPTFTGVAQPNLWLG